MNSLRFILVGCLAVLLCTNCSDDGGSGGAVMNPGGTQLTLSASPSSVLTGQSTTFTITANNSENALTSASIDFESDGTWDETAVFNHSSITTTFSHAYVNAGTYTARAEVIDTAGTPATKTTQVTVTAPQLPPVTLEYQVYQSVNAGIPGTCYVTGPVLNPPGVSTPSGPTNPISLGSYARGATVTVSQGFRQNRFTNVANSYYGCYYGLRLWAGTPGSEVQFGSGNCSTSSTSGVNDPELFTCTVTVTGVVP